MRSTHPRAPGAWLRQRGFTLVEAAVALIIMGVAAAVFWQAIGGRWAQENLDRVQSHLARAEAAVLVFAGLHGRLPCPSTSPNGQENCDVLGNAVEDRYFPYMTVGVPEPEMARLRYTVQPVATNTEDWPFEVRANPYPISRERSPAAVRMNLSGLVAPSAYDNLLDLCEKLSVMATQGSATAAYSIMLLSKDSLVAGFGNKVLATRPVSAGQVLNHLGCDAMVAISGRGQYNAHLSAAIMAKAAQDFRSQLELSYATYILELAEGSWSVASHTYGMLVSWAKGIQALSAVKAKTYSPWGLAVAIANETMAITTQTMGLVSWGARVSNLARFANNLKNYRNHLRFANQAVATALENYQVATRHAMLGSTSAYFLREQAAGAPGLPAGLGMASDYGPNPLAQGAIETAMRRADGLLGGTGPAGAIQAHASWPGGFDELDSDRVADAMIEDSGRVVEDAGIDLSGVDEEALFKDNPGAVPSFDESVVRDGERQSRDAQRLADAVSDQLDPRLRSEVESGTFNPDTFDRRDYDSRPLRDTLRNSGVRTSRRH